ncbi:DUF3558 domain-containing protein [Streptomyces nondiastaticus]|uniref:DUF3558 domain-containing protein n=1 Tax=Streptomyces nondiastaticus TaxID=3154512 RepID=A0ABW6TWY3_9ACTN
MGRMSRVLSGISLTVLTAAGCSTSGQPTTAGKTGEKVAFAEPIKTDSITQSSICKIVLTEAQQKAAGIRESTPTSDKDAVSCYFSMTPGTSKDSAGYVVTLFKNQEALLQTADGTNPMPTKAAPKVIKGRMAAQQIMYGGTWKASLTVDIGSGQFLFAERYSPGHVVAEKDLTSQADKIAEQVLENLRAK